MFIAHAALQRLNIVPQQSSTRIKVSYKQAAPSPFGFPADQQSKDLAQCVCNESDVGAQMHGCRVLSHDHHRLHEHPSTAKHVYGTPPCITFVLHQCAGQAPNPRVHTSATTWRSRMQRVLLLTAASPCLHHHTPIATSCSF